MSNIVHRKRRGTTSELATKVPAKGDFYIDTTKATIVVGDGATSGGVPLAKENHVHSSATPSTAGFMSAADKTKLDALSSAGGYATIQSNGGGLTQRATVNFSSQFTAVDNNGSDRTDVSLSTAFLATQDQNVIALVLALS